MPVISLIITGIAIFAMLIGMLVGLFRRTYRSLMRMATYIISAVIAALITVPVTDAVYGPVWSTVKGSIPSLSQIETYITGSQVLTDIVRTLPEAILSLVLFGVLFVIISLIMLIPYCIVAHKVVKKDKKVSFKGDRLVGMATGAVAGLLVVSILFAPVAGFVSTASAAFDSVTDNGNITEIGEMDVQSIKTDYITPVAGNWFMKLTATVGKGIYIRLMSANVAGTDVCYADEIINIANVYSAISPALESGEGETLNYVAVVSAVIPKVSESPLIKKISADVISGLGKAWANKEAYFGIEPIAVTGFAASIYESALNILANTTENTLTEDLATVSSLLDTMDKYHVVDAFSNGEEVDALALLAQDGLISELLTTAASNERTKELVSSVVNAGIQAVGEYLQLPATQQEVRTNFIDAVADGLNTLSADEFEAKFTSYMSDHGVDLPEDLVPLISESLTEAFASSIPNVRADEVEEFFGIAFDISEEDLVSADNSKPVFSFADNSGDKSSAVLVSLTAEEIANRLKNEVVLKLKGISQVEIKIMSTVRGLANADEFKSDKVTIEDLKIDQEAMKEKLSNTEEVASLGNSVSGLVSFVSSLNTPTQEPDPEDPTKPVEPSKINIGDIDMKGAGAALDGLLGNDILGDAAINLIDAVVQSDVVKEALPIDISNINLGDVIRDNDTSLENLLEAAQKTAVIVQEVSNTKTDSTGHTDEKTEEEQQKSQEAIDASVEWLIANMSTGTAKTLKNILSADLVKSYGVPEAYAEGIVYTLGILFDKMAAATNLTASEFKAESAAVKSLFDIAVNTKDNKFDISKAIDTIMGSKIILETVHVVCNEKGTDPLGVGKVLNSNTIKDALSTYTHSKYAEAADKAVFKDMIISLGKLCGTDFSKEFDGWIK